MKITLSRHLKGVIWVLISASNYGILVVITKFAYKEDINAITLLFLRFLFASVILFGHIQFENLDLKLVRKDLVVTLVLGGLFFGATFGFFHSLYYLSTGTAVLMSYTYLAFVTLIALYFLNEHITTKILIALFLALAGVFLIIYSNDTRVTLNGIALVITSSVINSVYITLSKVTVKNIDPEIMAFYIIIFVTFAYFISGVSTGLLQIHLTLKGTLLILFLGIISAVISITFFKGLKLIEASVASVLTTFGSVITVILAFLLLGEMLSPAQLLGGILIIISVFILGKRVSYNDISKGL